MKIAANIVRARRHWKPTSCRKAYEAVWAAKFHGRVKQCESCSRTTVNRGTVHAYRQGWRWGFALGRIVWFCPECRGNPDEFSQEEEQEAPAVIAT